MISAAKSVSYGKGKTVPLTPALHPEGDRTRLSMAYATSGGLQSPEDAVKRHVCMTMAAASAAATSNAPLVAPQALLQP